jgi:hypothetical protein
MLEESQKELQEHFQDMRYQLTRLEDRIRIEEKRLAVFINEYAGIMARVDRSDAAASLREAYQQTKAQSEQLLGELTEERERLHAALATSTIDDSLIVALAAFAESIKDDIDALPFSGRRELIEKLDVRGELTLEQDQRVLYIIWHTHRFRKVLTG